MLAWPGACFSNYHFEILEMSTAPSVYIVASVRTPVGAFNGSLSSLSAVELGTHVIKAAINRTPNLKAEDVEEVFIGNVLSSGLGQNVARQCALGAGLPISTVSTTVNKVCASSLKAITLAAQTIQLGHADVVIAGGTESMSNAPNYVSAAKSDGGEEGSQSVTNGLLQDGLRDAFGVKEHMGAKGEICARSHNISREQQDAFTKESYRKAKSATEAGWFKGEITAIKVSAPGTKPFLMKEDECISKFDEEKLKTLPPVFASEAAGGTITAANSPSLADGASAVVLVSEAKLKALQLKPLARLLGWADAETHPGSFTTAPSLAIPKALKRASLQIEDVDVFEINEAFAVATLANIRLLNIDAERVNVHGGSVALGHPLGASGCRVVATMLGVMQRQGKGLESGTSGGRLRTGAIGVCNGGGGATALVIENL